MPDLVLQTSDDLVARLAHEGDPIRAVVEMVWNAVDAEASTATVELGRDVTDAIRVVRVQDDGHGISSDEVETTFGRIGDSWKRRSQKSKNGKRPLHGSLGEGRLRAFALGSRVVWSSQSVNTAGVGEHIEITGDRSNRHIFRWEAHPSSQTKTGTTVTAHNEAQRSLAALDGDAPIASLQSHFAPVLLNEAGLSISYGGTVLDPAREILHDIRLVVPFGEGDRASELSLRIIEWRSGKHRAIYYAPDDQHFVYEEPGGDVEGQFAFSAYVTWDGMMHHDFAVLQLGDMAPEPVNQLWRAARKAIREHFAARRRERRREQVEQWKELGVYPYQGRPTTEPERAERAVFDVVSGALVPHIPKGRDSARLTLALLRDAIRHDPDKLTAILHEVVSLSDTDRDTLTELLSETTLPAIIRSANLVATRHKFLAGLEHLLFDPTDSAGMGERDHLHRILERELWIFGEGYHLMSSERGLTQLLRTHLRLEGLPTKEAMPVRRWTGKSGRIDLHLAARYREHDRVRHLVVELKAPDVTIGRRELDQVEDYGNAILTSPQFSSGTAQWDLILIGTSLDEVAQNRVQTDDFELGKFWGPQPRPGQPRVTAYVRRWRDVLDENKRRLDFVTSALEHDPSITEGLDYVRARYSDLLPILATE
ncbi:MAG TPA: ATP-binding protein [Micromonosporaceae bacterium]|nr:ATP-binding protein [Micromonosporaceae bacterium]